MNGDSPKTGTCKGIATIWVAIILFMIVAIVGLGVDAGYVLLGAHRLQNAADAAALAGAALVKTDLADARAAAIHCASANQAAGVAVTLVDNGGNAVGGDLVIGRYDRSAGVFTPTTESPNAFKVVARRINGSTAGRFPLIFGRIFGVQGVDVARSAVAMTGGGSGAGVIALSPDAPKALTVSGSVTLDAGIGAIQVNSDDKSAVFCNGGPTLLAPEMNVCGGVRFVGGVDFDGDVNPDATPVEDPLAFLPEIEPSAADDLGTISVTNGVHDLEPGYYSGGISATGGALNLAPGVYVLDGAGLDIGGNTMFLAEGVMLYITGSGRVDLGGTGDVTLTPPDPTLYSYPGVDTYEGVSIFQDRDSTGEAKIVGTSMMDLDGTLYFPAANVVLSGTGDGFGNQLVGDTIEVTGTGQIEIAYDGRFPAAGNRVFLVE